MCMDPRFVALVPVDVFDFEKQDAALPPQADSPHSARRLSRPHIG